MTTDFYDLPDDLHAAVVSAYAGATFAWSRTAQGWVDLGSISEGGREHLLLRLASTEALAGWLGLDLSDDACVATIREAVALPARPEAVAS